MTDQAGNREISIRGYARETALCVDLPLAAIEEQIAFELRACDGNGAVALQRLLKTVQRHRKLVERFTILA